MMRRWDDSQKYLSDNSDLVCEETANYLVIMCIDLEVEEVMTTRKECVLLRSVGADNEIFTCFVSFRRNTH